MLRRVVGCPPRRITSGFPDVLGKIFGWTSGATIGTLFTIAKRGEYIGTSRWLMQQLFNRGLERTRLHGGVKGLAGVSLKPKDYGERLPYRDD